MSIQHPKNYGETKLKIDINYKASPETLTSIMTSKMRQLIKDILLGYKHYAETGRCLGLVMPRLIFNNRKNGFKLMN